MPRWLSSCQIDFHVFGILASGLVVVAIAFWPALTAFAQQPGKPDAEAATLARRTLAAKLSLPIERIKVVSVSPAEWRDSSLGCPERGMVYTQVLTSGYKVTLRAADREHVVHVAGTHVVICSSQGESKLAPAALISGSLKASDAVRAALAARLRIDPARVRIVSTRPARSDSRPCAAAPSEPSGAAFVVDAQAETQTFRYYTDDAVTVSCEEPARKPK
jgi:hypothetical protein